MNKNTITGLFLIGLVLTVFAVLNQPSKEEVAAKERKIELAAKEKKTKKVKAVPTEKKAAANTGNDTPIAKEIKAVLPVQKAETFRIENKELIIDLNSKGGQVEAVYLKNYLSYYSKYVKKNKEALCLFKTGDATNQLVLPLGEKTIYTSNYFCKATKVSKNALTFEMQIDENRSIEYKYSIGDKGFDLNYDVKLIGFNDAALKHVQLNWKTSLRKTERLFSEQRRVSTVCYDQVKDGFTYLSETSGEFTNPSDDINWIAYKQSYFSAILKPKVAFSRTNGLIGIKVYKDGEAKQKTHLKDYVSNLGLNFNSGASSSMVWSFVPNDYNVLKSYDSDYDAILNYGWGVFRWINLYAVQPIFNVIISSGLGVGWAILVLTIILKLILMPVQWKMFLSSVKMKILKPEIDELNAKFPNKDDAMKKQVEMMALYKESGASPLAGCVPMLIQMPILLAVFRFFPATFGLRQQGFLWAEDLSSYDSILDFGFNVWPYGDHVSLFTLLMSATTLLYTFMNSGNVQQPTQPGMPNMKVIMYVFPLMMIFFFNNYSAGLSYYYFISTLVSILIMVVIKQFFVNEDKLKLKMASRKATASANPKVKKKSRFQEKLEEMQKQQQEMIKNKKK
jgi:YidC/Oxa1 family membrane protein insertase